MSQIPPDSRFQIPTVFSTPHQTSTSLIGFESPIAHDSSGLGHDGTYFTEGTPPEPRHAPGVVMGDLSLHGAQGDPNTHPSWGVNITSFSIDTSQDFSVCWWQSNTFHVNLQEYYGVFILGAGGNAVLLHQLHWLTGEIFQLRKGITNESWATTSGSVPADGFPHFFALTYVVSTGTPTFYLDGVVVPWAASGPEGALSTRPITPFVSTLIQLAGIVTVEYMDEVVFFQRNIGSSDIMAMYIAGLNGFAAWDGQVSTMSPLAYYHLDDLEQARATATNVPDSLKVRTIETINLIKINPKEPISASNTATPPLVPAMAVVPNTGASTVSISGRNFTPGATINQTTGVTFNGSPVTLSASITILSDGNWYGATFTVPSLGAGTYAVVATDSFGVHASSNFLI